MISSTELPANRRAEALAVFRARGYNVRRRAGTEPLWPGDVRETSSGIEWRARDEDPAQPLWELLQELHSRGDVERLGRALTLLVDRALTPRQVLREIQLQEAAA